MKFNVEEYLEWEEEIRAIDEWYQDYVGLIHEDAGDRV